MQDIAIKVENVSKIFRIYDKPSDRLKETFSFRKKKYCSDFQALRDISFDVPKGTFMGIVGKNGAGKSTLLKILSRELTPSAGRVAISGKVSLLQLGVGFDPELTGIENARFASKLLGYTDDEIESMLEDIIAFADIGEFIRHPVKTYSSGMYSRLSFAVGINIDPDILIADEVLSVGDMRFSQKCLRKMREFKEKGKTVVLVTHDTRSVNVFCDTAIWLKDGLLYEIGDAKSVATDFTNYMLYDKLPNEYYSFSLSNDGNGGSGRRLPGNVAAMNDEGDKTVQPDRSDVSGDRKYKFNNIVWENVDDASRIGEGGAKITGVAVYLNEPFEKRAVFEGNETVCLFLRVKIESYIRKPHFGFVLYDGNGLPAIHTNSDLCGGNLGSLKPGNEAIVCFEVKLPGIGNGHYIAAISAEENQVMLDRIHDVLPIQIFRPGLQGTQCGRVIIEEQRVEMGVKD